MFVVYVVMTQLFEAGPHFVLPLSCKVKLRYVIS